MNQIKIILKKIGLTDTEAEIYLTGLYYDGVTVNELEKQTRIKRTTIYHALNTMSQKGLASKISTESKTRFNMTAPEKIGRLLDREITALKDKKQELETLVPLLDQKIKQAEAEVKISHYQGQNGVKLVVEEALYCRSRRWEIIAPVKNFFSDFDKTYARYFLSTRRDRGIVTRSLWEYAPSGRVLTAEEIKERNPRYLPKVMHGKFKAVIILFDDKAAIISSYKELAALLIQSQEMHDTLLAMFEGLWQNSEEYSEKVKD